MMNDEEMIERIVIRVLERMGVDTSDPKSMRKDLERVREWRECVDSVQSKSILTMVGLAIAGGVVIFIMGIKEWFKSGAS